MTVHRQHNGEILEVEDTELKTLYSFSNGEKIEKEETEPVYECDLCGEIKQKDQTIMIQLEHFCKEHIADEVIEAAEGEEQ